MLSWNELDFEIRIEIKISSSYSIYLIRRSCISIPISTLPRRMKMPQSFQTNHYFIIFKSHPKFDFEFDHKLNLSKKYNHSDSHFNSF